MKKLFTLLVLTIVLLLGGKTTFAFSGSGSGTSGDPYLVTSAAQLAEVASGLAAYYKQTADIALTGTWTPIGTSATKFTGTYDGDYHKITGLSINVTAVNAGLFGFISGATIKNIGIEGASAISTASSIGILAGTVALNSVVDKCYSTGTCSGTSVVGGLIGSCSASTITNSYSTANVTSNSTTTLSNIGGFIGSVATTTSVIQNCYATGSVTGNKLNIGGFAGLMSSASGAIITNCYSSGSVTSTGGSAYGGFLGSTSGGTASGCFWDTQTTGQSTSAGGGTGKTTAEMQTKLTYTSATWDFAGETANGSADYWGIGSGYPYLLSLSMKITTTDFPSGTDDISAFTKTYLNSDFTITPVSHNYSSIETNSGFNGFYSYDYSTDNGTEFTISAPGYSFDLSAFKYYLESVRLPSLTVTLTFIDGSTDTKTYTFTGASTGVYTFTSFTTTANDVKSIKFVSDNYMTFNNFAIDDIKVLPTKPTVTTTAISIYDASSATMGGNVTASGTTSVTERGVVYSTTDGTPTIGESGVTKVAIGSGTGSFSQSVGSLTAGTLYYVNSYSTNSAGTSYGTGVTFTTTASVNPVVVTASAGITIPTGYPTLKEAFDAINLGTHKGDITVQINASTTETASAVLYYSGFAPGKSPTGSNYNSVNVYPTTTGLTISGAIDGPLVDLDGADKVTIDGRVNATGSAKDLVITNISTASTDGTSTIRFINDASANKVKYCTIKGSSTTNSAQTADKGAIVFFSTGTVTGNDGNTIEYNNFTNAGSRPRYTIYSQGTDAKENDGDTIRNNNFYDFFSLQFDSYGIELYLNNTAWTLSDNSFYETISLKPVENAWYYFIDILNEGVDYTVSNNHIGGQAANCGGSAFTKTNAYSNPFYGIQINVGTTTASSVQGNVIKNFSWSNLRMQDIYGIRVNGGAVNIGTSTGNQIGEVTGAGSITMTNTQPGGTFYGLELDGTGSISASNNTIGSITVANTNSGYATNFKGIYTSATNRTLSLSNNTITGINASSGSMLTVQKVYGIYCQGTGTNTLNLNTVAGLTNGSTGTYGQIIGIYASSGANTVTNNNVHHLSIAAGNFYADDRLSVAGISLAGSGAAQTVSGNTVHDLSNSYPDFDGCIAGLYLALPITAVNAIAQNFIYNLSFTGTGIDASVYGIKIAGGLSTYSNNIISLGGNISTTLYGIYETGATGNDNSLYFNTVYISGFSTSNLNKSYALYSARITNTRDFRNNIFHNDRIIGPAKAPGYITGTHYAAYFAATTGPLTCDYNDYYVSTALNSGGMLGYFSGNQPALPIVTGVTGNDAHSKILDPVFASAGGILAANYKPSESLLLAVTGTGILKDYIDTTRSTNYPAMGAYEYAVTPPCSNAIEVANTSDAGAGSLRQAIADLCPDGTITFNASLDAGTITLTSGELLIDKGMTIDASALADGISVSGNSASRVFNVDCASADVTINKLIIKNGLAAVEGGGLYQVSPGAVTFNNVTFNSNTALWGAAIYLNAGTQTFNNCRISENTAVGEGSAGGGFYQKSGTSTFNTCEILNNASTTFGGGVYLETAAAELTFNGSTVSGNTVSDGSGGGMYINNGTVHLNNSQIKENNAQYLTQFGDGGAIYFYDGTLSSSFSKIMNNTAANCGGGLFIHSVDAVFSSIDDSISGNMAQAAGNVATPKGGGGVYVYHGNAGFTRTTISGNQTPQKGGGIYLAAPTGTVNLSSCTVSGNETKNGPANDVNYGGGIFIDNATVLISNSVFTGNKATRTDSNGPKGGAIYLFNGTLGIAGTSFSNNQTNTAQGKGGAIFNDFGALNCDLSTFTSNSAGRSGGAIFNNQATSSMNNSNCTFTSNSAARLGGALYMQNGTMTNDRCLFETNSTTGILGVEAGGAINHNLGTSTTKNCTLKTNSSTLGGGFYFKDGTASIINSLMFANAAATNGGGVFTELATAALTVTNSTIVGNSAVTQGGGLAVQNGIVNVKNSIIWNNTAPAAAQFGRTAGTLNLLYCDYSIVTNDVAGTFTPTSCMNYYPNFVSEVGNDYRLGGNSPCADAGNNSYCSETYDIRGTGYGRNLNKTTGASGGTIDMGAYEYKFVSDPEFGCTNPTAGGVIALSQSGCVSFDPSGITGTAPTGEHGTLEYKWQISTTSDLTGFTDIGSATASTYDPGTLTATTWYKRIARVSCMINWTGSDTSNVVKMTVYPAFTAGAINKSGETICYSGDPGVIGDSISSGGGNAAIVYQWQSSLNAAFTGTPTNISSNTDTYTPAAGLTATTWYRRQAKDGACDTTFTSSANVWKVTVYDSFTTGTISSTGQTICYAGTPSVIGSTTAASGGYGAITYSWRSSADSYAAAISGAISATYTPAGPLTSSTSYRRYAKDSTCNITPAVATGTWTVTVRPQFATGEISATGQTICYNTSPTTAIGNTTSASGGDATITYSWRSSVDSYVDTIGGAISATYTPAGPLTSTTSYRRYAKDNTCNTTPAVATGTWTVTVDPASNGGNISGGATVCYGTNSTLLTLYGQTGTVVKWQYTTDAGYNWYDIANTNATYTATDLTTTTSYRAVVQSGVCSATPGGYANVTVRPVFTAGSIKKAGETICYNDDPALIGDSIAASGGDAAIEYQWQSSLNAGFTGTPTDIATNDASYDPPANHTTTTWYRRQAKEGTCNTNYTTSAQVWKVTVRPVFTAGNIKKSGETICYNGDPALIGDSTAASGGNAAIEYQWQSSTNAGFTGTPTNIATNAASYNPPAKLTTNTWYRRQAKDGLCNASFTSSACVWKVSIEAIPPVAQAKNITKYLDASGNATIAATDIDNGSTDNCSIATWVASKTTFNCSNLGPNSVILTVTDSAGNSATATSVVTVAEGTALPSPFVAALIGSSFGTATYSACNLRYTLTSKGFSSPNADVHESVYRPLTGNGSIVVRVLDITGGGWAGVQIRESSAPGAKKVLLKTQFQTMIRSELRLSTGGAHSSTQISRQGIKWLKLERTGNRFDAYTSVDGIGWRSAFSTSFTMAATVQVGFFTESLNNTVITQARFDKVVVTSGSAKLTESEGLTSSPDRPGYAIELYPTRPATL